MRRITLLFISLLMLASTCWLVVSCASLGTPDGGPFDEDPPVLVNATPALGAVNARNKKIRLYFDEYIKLDNPSEKVVISPPQKEVPNIMAEGKRIRIDLYDSLRSNTTYTIDFSDAISDNNEGNPMGLFTYSFSTGPVIDTMEVSGTVLDASNLEPIKGISVGLYPCDSLLHDSVFRTTPLSRIGRTNGSGRFTIKGVKPGTYRAFALKDMDGNYCFSQKSEMIAFDTTTFVTDSRPDFRPDTVWVDSTHFSKIRMVPYMHYYPEDLVLLAFVEGGQDRHLLKTERQTPEKFRLFFTAPSDSLPIIDGLNFDASKLYVEPNQTNDTITYWIPDTTVAYLDTLFFNLTYFETDTLGQLALHTDSMKELVPKSTHAKLERERQKKIEEWEKEQDKRRKKAKEAFKEEPNPYLTTYMTVSAKNASTLAPNQHIILQFSEPIAEIDTGRIVFQQKVDTNFVSRPFLLLPDDYDPKKYHFYAEWEPKATYQMTADSLTFRSIMGNYTKSMRLTSMVRGLNEFGTIFVKLTNLSLVDGETAYVELLNRSDQVVARMPVENDRADFYYLTPGDYYMRLLVDRDDDGKWSTGNYNQQQQPEDVFYFPRPIALRALFEVEQEWNVRGIARDKQKPLEITKQKPDKQKSLKTKNQERQTNTLIGSRQQGTRQPANR